MNHDFENQRNNQVLSALNLLEKTKRIEEQFQMDQRTVRLDSELAQKDKIRSDIEKAKQKQKYHEDLRSLITQREQ